MRTRKEGNIRAIRTGKIIYIRAGRLMDSSPRISQMMKRLTQAVEASSLYIRALKLKMMAKKQPEILQPLWCPAPAGPADTERDSESHTSESDRVAMFPQMAMVSICLSQRCMRGMRMDASAPRGNRHVAVNPFTANVDVCCEEARGVNEHVRG